MDRVGCMFRVGQRFALDISNVSSSCISSQATVRSPPLSRLIRSLDSSAFTTVPVKAFVLLSMLRLLYEFALSNKVLQLTVRPVTARN